MKNYAMFNYDYIFGDHFSNVSDQAKLLYMEMMFYANDGFVSNPKSIMDSRGYGISVLNELIANGDILKLDDRCEVFITSFYIHNKGIKNTKSWLYTPYAVYWRNKLFIKNNGVATFKPQTSDNSDVSDSVDKIIIPPKKNDDDIPDWDELVEQIGTPKLPF